MVDYTPEVAAARAEFLRAQEEIMARHAAEDAENIVDDDAMEVEDMSRKRRDAEPVVIPTHTNVLPTTYHHLSYPVYQTSVYNPYLSYSPSGESSHSQPSSLHGSWQLSHLQDHPT